MGGALGTWTRISSHDQGGALRARLAAGVAAGALILGFGPAAWAGGGGVAPAGDTWTGTAGDGLWRTGGNWTPAGPPAIEANFPDTANTAVTIDGLLGCRVMV